MIEQLVRSAVSRQAAHSTRVILDGCWLRVEPAGCGPAQGWKLHVSATVPSAEAVLRAALPPLLGGPVRFKVAASLEHLQQLNSNDAPLAQVGKFITVYPAGDGQAVQMAAALDAATSGLCGPAIHTDRPFRPGSLVHYRYGSFRPRYLQTPLGQLVPAISAPDGTPVADLRTCRYTAPAWAADPFREPGAEDARDSSPLRDGRYRVEALLQQAPRGTIERVVDVLTGQRRVLKSARHHALAAPDGTDARDRLRAERAMLQAVAALPVGGSGPIGPRVHDHFRQGEDEYLVLEYVAGNTLHATVTALLAHGVLPSDDQVLRWAIRLTGLIGPLHAHGIVHRDITARNVIEEPSGTLRLVDFELAWSASDQRAPCGLGSPGAMSPEQRAGARPRPADDVYAIGALLYFALTGVDPAQAPRPHDLLAQPLTSVPTRHPRERLIRVVTRALDPDPAVRYADAGALHRVLTGASPAGAERRARPSASTASPADDGAAFAAAAHTAGALLRRQILQVTNSRLLDDPGTPLGLDTGLAGLVLGFCSGVTASSDPADREVLAAAATALAAAHARQQRTIGMAATGLYSGAAGVGLALASAGILLDDSTLVDTAARMGEEIAAQPTDCPDVFAGAAGCIRFHLWLSAVTGADVQLQAAQAAGRALVAAGADGSWLGPASYGHLPARPYLGYARGAAGVADVLLDLYEVTGDDRFHAEATKTARLLAAAAEQPVPAGSAAAGPGRHWRVVPNGPFFGPYWCHGAAGIGQFLLHAARHDSIPDAANLAQQAADAVAQARWAGPGQCHGLAGNIEFLLDVYHQTGLVVRRNQAAVLGRLLLPFLPEPDLVEPAAPAARLPDGYMFGLAGMLVALQRLLNPGWRPHQPARCGPAVAELGKIR